MNKVRSVIAGVLICAVAIGWVLTLTGNISDISQYNNSIETARTYVEKGLYQKAIITYETALEYKSSVAVYDELLNAYKLGLEDGVVKASSYTTAYENVCTVYPNEVKYWEDLFSYYMSANSYSSAYELYKQIVKAGVKSETLSSLADDLLYSYQIKPTNYSSYFRSPTGYYTVSKDNLWGILKPDGEIFSNCTFTYAVPISAAGNCILQSEKKGTRVYNSSGIVQYILSESFVYARSYGGGLVPVNKSGSEWDYFDAEENAYSGKKYEDASSFTSSVAAVKNGGKWILVDTEFNQITEGQFDDVKLYHNGEYVYSDVVIASQNGAYKIFDAQGTSKSEFSAADMDNYYGDYIAFKDSNGLWGYVDIEGNIVIEPQFKDAKSFSNGLAAVFNGEKWGFIKADGTVVIDYQYVSADYFTSEGFCMVGDAPDAFFLIELRYV